MYTLNMHAIDMEGPHGPPLKTVSKFTLTTYDNTQLNQGIVVFLPLHPISTYLMRYQHEVLVEVYRVKGKGLHRDSGAFALRTSLITNILYDI